MFVLIFLKVWGIEVAFNDDNLEEIQQVDLLSIVPTIDGLSKCLNKRIDDEVGDLN